MRYRNIIHRLFDLETRFFLPFLLLCKYRFRYFTLEDIKQYQDHKIRKLLKYAIARSAFYRKHYSGYDLKKFCNLPSTNKNMLIEHLTDCNTVGLKKDEILDFCIEAERTRDFSRRLKGINVGMSSGTGGNKGVEIATQEEENFLKAAFFARFDFPRKEKIRLAFFLRVSSPAFNLNKFGHSLTYFSQLDSLGNITTQLKNLQPNIISAPPSMLKIFAREIEAGRLKISVKRIISYAEVLHPEVKTYIKQIFGCPVHEIYKCSEGAIAITCKYEKLHINEDLVAVELYNRDGSPTELGKPCHQMIITDLHKKSLPIIRYTLNDIITISPQKCSCGSNFRVIENVQGRADEMFWGISVEDQSKCFIYQDYISRMIITVSDDIEEFQAIQKDFTFVILRVVLKPLSPERDIIRKLTDGIRDVFTQYHCIPPTVEVIFAPPLRNINSNKLSRVICEIQHERN